MRSYSTHNKVDDLNTKLSNIFNGSFQENSSDANNGSNSNNANSLHKVQVKKVGKKPTVAM